MVLALAVRVAIRVEGFEIAQVRLDGVDVPLRNEYNPVSVGHINYSTQNSIKVGGAHRTFTPVSTRYSVVGGHTVD